MAEEFDEKELLVRCASGDRQAFACLYQRHLQPLYRHTYLFTRSRELSEEIVQDVFIRLWENRHCFLRINSFRNYLHQMAKNMVIDHLRKLKTEKKAIQNIRPSSEADELSTDDLIVYKDYLHIAEEAINNLTDKRKEIFLMRTQQDLTIDQIAASLHISRSVVKKQLYTSLHLVRQHIEKMAQLSSGTLIIVALFY